jgi:Fic family protein
MKKAFNPDFLPIRLDDQSLIDILRRESDARAKLERFNSMLERSIIREELLMLFSLDESVQSTKIEGTQATISEVVESEMTGKKNVDIQEVDNYVEAIRQGFNLLASIPISTRLFHRLHKIILNNARGQNRSPGNYRIIQNFIGPTNKIEDATYIPPEPQNVERLIGNLERYINNEYDDHLGYIARAAVIHGQFETIYPYLDGNGRLGRIIIILYLVNNNILTSPTFFISEELERSKFKYYGLLNNLRNDEPQWREWILYFIESTIKQANHYIEKLEKIEALYKELVEYANQKNIKTRTINAIFKKPFFTVKYIQEEVGVSYNTAKRYIDRLVEIGRIYPDDKKKNKIYRFYDLIDAMR